MSDPEEILPTLETVNVDPKQAFDNARDNLNFLAAMCLQEDFLFNFPSTFLAIWAFLKSKIHLTRDFSQLALGIPRGFAKTTLIKIWCVFCVLFTEKKFICIISHTEDHAQNIIKDVCGMLSTQNIKSIFGQWNTNIERDRVDCKIFIFRGRRIILAGLGANGSIRGLNVGNARPDVMIFEDFQRKVDSENEELSKKLYNDMYGTFMKAKSPFGCLFIFVANMYPTPGSILKKLKVNKDWTSFIVGGILEDGTSLWEDLQPIRQLLKEYQGDLNAGCPEVFLAEVLNDETAGLKAGIDITKLPPYPWDNDELPTARGIVIDPALDNPTSDYNGIGLVGIYDGVPTLEKVDLGRYSPLQLIKNALIMGFENSCRLITVENANIQKTYLFWFEKICLDHNIEGFTFLPLSIGGGTKNGKIAAALKKWQKKELLVKPEVRPILLNEVIKWNPNKKNNSDTCLDLMVMADKIVEEHGAHMIMPYEHEFSSIGRPTVLEIEENCNF
jgi:hypothetical protein